MVYILNMATESIQSPVGVTLPAKVDFLKQAAVYPDSPPRVDARETHMSWVFLTDRYAYKLKKPVRYEFLDFSTVSARRLDCEEEVRLNRRLAGKVYIGTVPLTIGPKGSLQLGGNGEAIDWLVKMQRLPTDRMLDCAILHHTAGENDILRVARLLARFYKQAAPIATEPAEYRRQFREKIRANLLELAAASSGLPLETAQKVHGAQLDFLKQKAVLFDQRVHQGKHIEGHGDLRPEHICLEPKPVVIDCLEFNRAFRILDPADELAFLALECERLGAPSVGRLLFETYSRDTGDQPPPVLLDFYKSYRACLRAKIAVWHTREPQSRGPAHWRDLARDYLRRAAEYSSRW